MSKITGFTQYLKHFELSFLFLGSLTEFWTFQYVVENSIRSWSSSSFSEDLAKNRTLLCWEMRKHIRQFFPQRACRLVPSRVVSLMWKLECRCMKLRPRNTHLLETTVKLCWVGVDSIYSSSKKLWHSLAVARVIHTSLAVELHLQE